MEVAARAIAGRRSKIAQESSDQRVSSAGEEQPTSQACLARFPLLLEGRRSRHPDPQASEGGIRQAAMIHESRIFRMRSGGMTALSEGDTRRSLGEHTNPTEELSLFRSSAFYLMKSVSRS
jgi:hypothetical protein